MAFTRMVQGTRRSFSQWEKFDAKKLVVKCCDCGLVHQWQLRIDEKGTIFLRTKRKSPWPAKRRRVRGSGSALRERREEGKCDG